MSQELQNSERIFGLDFLRAVAISMIVFSYVFILVGSTNPVFVSLSGLLGYAGVELFFVLSGFLIGTIILKAYLSDSFNSSIIAAFLKRRGMRTLPNYYVVLVLNIILGISLGYDMKGAWRYFFFLQNFTNYQITFFYESWSLSVVEWAYFIIPFLFWFTYKISTNRKLSFLLTSLGLIFFFHLIRFWFHKNHFISDLTQWNEQVKSIVLYRIDSVLIGFVVAWLHFFYKDKMKNICVYLFILALHLFFLQFVAMNVLGYDIISKPTYFLVFYFTFSSVTFALTLPIFANWKNAKGFIAKIITWISKLSYGMYLVHFGLISVLITFLKENYLQDIPVSLLIVIYLFFVTLFSYLLYNFVEKPFMNRR
jgi:peptidoglycan/LPS O-acetylase OafA/YrhL